MAGSGARRSAALTFGLTLIGAVVVGPVITPASADPGWNAIEAPLPANATVTAGTAGFGNEAEVKALSCPAAGACVAVGVYGDGGEDGQARAGLLDVESGNSWTGSEAPLTSGATDAGLDAVSCPAVATCVAGGAESGAHGGAEGNGSALVESLADGVWTPSTAPVPADPVPAGETTEATITEIDCPTAGSCVALGDDTEENTGASVLFMDTLSGGTWTTTTAPVPAAAADETFQSWGGLACPSVSSCVAVGTLATGADGSGSGQALIETWAHGAWSEQQGPVPTLPSGPYAGLSSVSCPSVGSCIAVGTYGTTAVPGSHDSALEGLIETLAGGHWSATELPLPDTAVEADEDNGLAAVSCATVGSCAAVGQYVDQSGDESVLATLAGGTWTSVEAPVPANGDDEATVLSTVACPSTASCVALGAYPGSSAGVEGLIETETGGGWTPTEAPLPADAAATETSPDEEAWAAALPGFTAVGCPAVGTCVGVGSYAARGPAPSTPAMEGGLIEDLPGSVTAVPATTTVVTTSAPTVLVGQTDRIEATVTGTGSGVPTGSVRFYQCPVAPGPVPCTFQSDPLAGPVSLTGGTGPTATAAVSITPDAPGYWCVGAYYGGDAGNSVSDDAGTDGCVDADPTTTTVAPVSAVVKAGQTDTVVATVTASAASTGPTGTVSFYDCGAEPCTTTDSPLGGPMTVTAGPHDTATASSPSFVTAPGTTCVMAYYSGDADDSASADTSADGCLYATPPTSSTAADPAEQTVDLGLSDTDVATVSSTEAGSADPTGTVSFFVCGPTAKPGSCGGEDDPVGGAVPVNTGSDGVTTATSPPFKPASGGWWCFGAHYSGDATHDPSADTAGNCFDVPPEITSANLLTYTDGESGTPFPVTTIGGYGPVSFSEDGTLPPGVTMSSAGVFSGTPETTVFYPAVATFPLTITATAADAQTSQEFWVNVAAPVPPYVVTTSPLPPAQRGMPYSVTLITGGAFPPDRWSISGGLPRGLRFDGQTGTISGKPRARTAGTYDFEVHVSFRISPDKGRRGIEVISTGFSLTVN